MTHRCVEELLWLSQPSQVLDKRDVERVEKHAIVFQDFLAARAHRFLEERLHSPILETFMSDGTPISTMERHHIDWDNFHINRAGKVCREFLVQRLWLQDSHGSISCLFGDIKLMQDKTHLTSYAGMTSLWQGARALGHKSFVLSHHVFDRAIMSAMRHRIRQRTAAWDFHLACTSADEAPVLILMTWVTVVGCQLHDYQNGLKWAVFHVFCDKGIMRDAWVVFASLRQSFEQLVQMLTSWLPAHTSFESCELEEDMAPWWRLLCISEDMLPLLNELKPRWINGKLRINETCEADPKCFEKVTGLILYTWSFRRWSEARWGGCSKSSRSLVLALWCGMEGVVNNILADKKQSHYYISGFQRLSHVVRRMMALTCATSLVTDEPLAIAKEDDRLVKRLPDIDAALMNNAMFCVTLPEWIIKVLADMGGQSPSEFRTDLFQSVISQLAYVRMRLREPRTFCYV